MRFDAGTIFRTVFMKTGTLIITSNASEGEMRIAERLREFSMARGRADVFVGSHIGEPDCYEVFLDMHARGIDTFCIIPLSMAEGNLTIWNMPKHLTLPDNSGSWTMIGAHDVAVRFSTALGAEPRIADAMERDLGEAVPGTGIIVAAYGSRLSLSEKTAEYYAEGLCRAGWNAVAGFTRRGPHTLKEAEALLFGKGCRRITVVPLFISADGPSFRAAVSELEEGYFIGRPVSEYAEFFEIMDSKIPEDWRARI